MPYYVGIDWSEALQDWGVIDETGKKIKHGRFPLTPDGLGGAIEALQQYRHPQTGALPPVCIESGRGVLAATFVAQGFPVHAVNPLKVARYRELVNVSGSKSDKADAFTIADVLRMNIDAHRPMPAFSAEMMSLSQIARAHQDTLWRTLRLVNEVRSLLFECWPNVLTVFKPTQLVKPEVLAVLRAWPTPDAAAGMTDTGMRDVLVGAGRSRYVQRDVEAWLPALTEPALRMPSGVQDAYGEHLRALIDMLDTCAAVERRMRDRVMVSLVAHPYSSLVETVPALGGVTAARLLAEIGDDPERFGTAKNVQAFLGTAPVTKASSGSTSVKRRHIKNNRGNHAAFLWALSGIRHSPGVKAAYDHRRHGTASNGRPLRDKHAAALRNVSNRMVGCLWHCMVTGQVWDDDKVWASIPRPAKAEPLPAFPQQDPADRMEDSEPEFDELLRTEAAVAALA